ncbi:MAG: CPBP family intramembrane metalloprotease, partial [Planctomycetaceae bacterium]|nr:CPBP family intramembrane metalloprotease [Planctomycetaceae bacterium]
SAAEQQTLLAQLDDAMNVGDPLARLRFVVMVGEFAGPQRALDELRELRDKLAEADRQLTPTEQHLADALEQVYRGFVAAPAEPAALDEAQTKLLADKLGWFGRLALAPAEGRDQAARQKLLGAAQRTLLWGGGAMFVAGSVALVGLVLLVTILILAGNGTLSSGVIPSPIPPGIYAEAFAIWMFTFVLFNVALLAIPLGDLKMLGVLAAQFCSMLLALAWPRFRGVPWRVIRHDAGIYLPRFAWLEPLRGLATYALSTPILGVGLVVMLILTQAKGLLDGPTDPFARPDVPAHPIVEVVRSENPWMFWQILLVAAVGAPIVEEIMFRGVLYRSLRDSTRSRRVLTSIILSMGVSGFIFAVIHPQGWLGIPVLGALATGFAIAREWGGTIWPSVIAHAFNNGMVTVLLFTLFRQ